MKKKKNKVKENVDYDVMYCEEMIRRLAKKVLSWNLMVMSETERLG